MKTGFVVHPNERAKQPAFIAFKSWLLEIPATSQAEFDSAEPNAKA